MIRDNTSKSLLKRIWEHRVLYLFIIPAVVWFFIFCYIPMYGVTLGFKEFSFKSGILGSPWAGLKYVKQFFTYFDFWKLIRNTVIISSLKLLFGFPAPIILALMLNEVRRSWFKRTIQTVSYLPFFMSWVVVITLFTRLLTIHGGPVNELKVTLFGGDPVFFMGSQDWFYFIVLFTHVWKSVGWNSIIYLAVMSNINPDYYSAASIDGAGRMKQIWYITIPSIMPTIGILFILSIGSLITAGYDQMYLLRQPSNLNLSEILDTYIVESGIRRGNYSLATVAGLFQAGISLILIIFTNKIFKKTTEISLW